MSIIKQSSTKFIGPASGYELAEAIGADHNEGVQVALFPSEPEAASLGGEFTHAPGVVGRPVMAECGAWGSRLLDIVLEGTNKGVKWWQVRAYAKEHKLDLVPVSWQGAIVDIPAKYFCPEMAVRFWNSGPWFWPIKGSFLEDNLRTLEVFCQDKEDDGQAIIRSVLGADPDRGA